MSRIQVMTQLVAFEKHRVELDQWCRRTLAPTIAKHPDVQSLVINLARENPLAEIYKGESLEGDDFDVIVQTWVPSMAAWENAIAPFTDELTRLCSRRVDFRITDSTVKNDEPTSPSDRPSPGYKLLRGLTFHSDLGPAVARRLWAHHAELAVQVHVGMTRYVQHWVDESLTPGGPAIDGFSELYFPSLEAMRDRYFDSERGKNEILHDIGHFIASGSKRFYGQEYRIK